MPCYFGVALDSWLWFWMFVCLGCCGWFAAGAFGFSCCAVLCLWLLVTCGLTFLCEVVGGFNCGWWFGGGFGLCCLVVVDFC